MTKYTAIQSRFTSSIKSAFHHIRVKHRICSLCPLLVSQTHHCQFKKHFTVYITSIIIIFNNVTQHCLYPLCLYYKRNISIVTQDSAEHRIHKLNLHGDEKWLFVHIIASFEASAAGQKRTSVFHGIITCCSFAALIEYVNQDTPSLDFNYFDSGLLRFWLQLEKSYFINGAGLDFSATILLGAQRSVGVCYFVLNGNNNYLDPSALPCVMLRPLSVRCLLVCLSVCLSGQAGFFCLKRCSIIHRDSGSKLLDFYPWEFSFSEKIEDIWR